MSYTKTLILKIGSFAVAAAVSLPTAMAGEDRPDLTGIWTNASLTNLTRPQGVEKLVVSKERAQEIANNTSVAGVSPEEADTGRVDPEKGAPPKGSRDFGLKGYDSFWTDPGSSLARVKGEYRTSYIVDPKNGQVPRLKDPKAKLNSSNFGFRYLTGKGDNSGPEALPLAERCLIGFGNTTGPGMMGTLYNSNYQFVLTDDHFMIMSEMVHDVRSIPIYESKKKAQANHLPDAIKPWFGDSVAWWEDDTLVVETINIKPLQVQQSSVPITGDGRIVERFSRYSDEEIFYQFTVEDPNLYSQPWTAELSFYATEGPIFEYACHEGNYALPGILAGARKKEQEAAEKNQ